MYRGICRSLCVRRVIQAPKAYCSIIPRSMISSQCMPRPERPKAFETASIFAQCLRSETRGPKLHEALSLQVLVAPRSPLPSQAGEMRSKQDYPSPLDPDDTRESLSQTFAPLEKCCTRCLLLRPWRHTKPAISDTDRGVRT